MLKNKFVILLLLFLIIMPLSYAKGGGGGSSSSRQTCKEDIWFCTDWKSCQSDGFQTRNCNLVTDCSSVDTPRPSEKESCVFVSELLSNLKCHNLPSLEERVRCRIQLEDAELDTELDIAYLPEECRTKSDVLSKERCVKLYAESLTCWGLKIGQRMGCIKNMLNLGDLNSQRSQCKGDKVCLDNFKKNAHYLIKFRFYELEERAEEAYEKGIITEDQVVDIVSKLESKKVEYNNVGSKLERVKILNEVKQLWVDFVKSIRKVG